jgi:hypothetical protein
MSRVLQMLDLREVLVMREALLGFGAFAAGIGIDRIVPGEMAVPGAVWLSAGIAAMIIGACVRRASTY